MLFSDYIYTIIFQKVTVIFWYIIIHFILLLGCQRSVTYKCYKLIGYYFFKGFILLYNNNIITYYLHAIVFVVWLIVIKGIAYISTFNSTYSAFVSVDYSIDVYSYCSTANLNFLYSTIRVNYSNVHGIFLNFQNIHLKSNMHSYYISSIKLQTYCVLGILCLSNVR